MPEEIFDIYDEHLNPIGTATRAETHKNGYWHRSFHCWLTRREGDRQFVRFQLRQACKDTNPSCFDITAAGHFSTGETLRDAVRELAEELGVIATFEELIPLGQVREDLTGIVNGNTFIDREVSDIFALICDLPMNELRLQPDEVAGVYEAGINELLLLFEGKCNEIIVSGVILATSDVSNDASSNQTLLSSQRSIRANQFVPRNYSYYIDVLQKLLQCT
ncbi:NUDIX domain-containing protein [Paenibacillus sp. GSMTC-2017]|uniref:NUDIX hydrolase n=1 Tax=Paenibacillus sp. GSMTC-2017 TaxID=2794350 RepID=UPI0018DA24C9|nr:NUDIX domain-containing protein [Paenibacillus sp. GSMTC-2017]MBH5318684.1 NUDIX domain-containing protein [Paenibacillus sp. GSMTC-2017]